MRTPRLALLAATAAIILALYGGIAQAKGPERNVMTLRLPDGQIEQVRYAGNVPPTVIVAPDAIAAPVFTADPFAMLDRISTQMHLQAADLFGEINSINPGQSERAGQFGGFATIPAASAPNLCMRSVQISFDGNGTAPHVVSRSSGNCGPSTAPATPVAVPAAPWTRQAPHPIEANAHSPRAGLVRMVSDLPR
ncbi:hypothetical protein [Rhodopila sp.]|uniref:hypothetical protein n=1 Tax=Rhodopila sp. TaxID=2480087 RepID=UPI003D0E6BE0